MLRNSIEPAACRSAGRLLVAFIVLDLRFELIDAAAELSSVPIIGSIRCVRRPSSSTSSTARRRRRLSRCQAARRCAA